MPKPRTIAIDGPAGSGKTTVGRALADSLGYLLFDTGVMYRAATLAALRAGVSIADEPAVVRVAETMKVDIRVPEEDDGRAGTVLLDGEDVTWELRSRSVDENVSPVSAYPGVRRALKDHQRRLALRGQIVIVGRDIGTVILPEADLKLYLDATAEERARRRHLELASRGGTETLEEVLDNVLARDRIDSGREEAPLRRAADAHYIDTTGMDLSQVLDTIRGLMDDDGNAQGTV